MVIRQKVAELRGKDTWQKSSQVLGGRHVLVAECREEAKNGVFC